MIAISTEYRSDIDGIRGIAVLAVIAYHAYPNTFTGGFVGVDIFFVISGFVISNILFYKIDTNNFSYVDFYFRRVRRIFPSLIIVLISCMLVGWLILYESELRLLGKHVTAGAGFYSNFVYWIEAGYFDKASEAKPLLHLWSLGVEAQFYLFWPLFLNLLWVWKNKFLVIALSISGIALLVNIISGDYNQSAIFYSPFSRLPELMAGGILAFVLRQRQLSYIKIFHWQALLGLIFILIGFLLISKETYFEGWWSLLPTLGTVLLILENPESWINKNLLSNRVLVWVGLISFPLYLWHWPLFSFVRILEGNELPHEIIIPLIFISIVLAWVTYKFVELPIRDFKNRRVILWSLCLTMLVIGSAGYFLLENSDFIHRKLNDKIKERIDNINYMRLWDGWGPCDNGNIGCWVIEPSVEPDVAVIGDSHAGHLARGLIELFVGRKNVVIQANAGCMPFYKNTKEGRFNCQKDSISRALNYAVTTPSIKTIILSGYGNLALLGRGMPAINSLDYSYGYTRRFDEFQVENNIRAFREEIDLTLTKLSSSNKTIIFIVDTPELNFNPLECISLRTLKLTKFNLRMPCKLDKKAFLERTEIYHSLIIEAEKKFPNVKFIHTYKYLCGKNYCDVLKNDKLLYSSRDHLSVYGSHLLINKIKNELE